MRKDIVRAGKPFMVVKACFRICRRKLFQITNVFRNPADQLLPAGDRSSDFLFLLQSSLIVLDENTAEQ